MDDIGGNVLGVLARPAGSGIARGHMRRTPGISSCTHAATAPSESASVRASSARVRTPRAIVRPPSAKSPTSRTADEPSRPSQRRTDRGDGRRPRRGALPPVAAVAVSIRRQWK